MPPGVEPPAEGLGLGRKPARHQPRAPDRRVTAQRGHQQARKHQRHRVGLPDVGDDLRRVDQAIDGDEIVPHAELVPKQPLSDRTEQEQVKRREKNGVPQPLRPAPPVESARQQRQPNRQRSGPQQGGGQIENQAPGKDRHQARIERDHGSGLCQQGETGEQSDRQKHEDENRHAAVAALQEALKPERNLHAAEIRPAN